MSLLINIKLSMTTCEFINRQTRNEKQHILKVTLTVVNSHRWFRRFPLNMVILNGSSLTAWKSCTRSGRLDRTSAAIVNKQKQICFF